MSRLIRPGLALSAALVLTLAGGATLPLSVARTEAQGAPAPMPDPAVLGAFKWRSIGPERGGRSLTVSGVKGQPNVGYFGATGGGLWKTTDKGVTWAPVTDGQITSSSVGAVAVSETNPDEVFIGTGESCIRGNIQPGDGVYKSTDAGKTWTHVGFTDGQNISKIRIHPTNPDVVFVAVFGKYSAPNDERGIYKSVDAGKTWKRVLFRDNKTAGVDLWIDHNHPDVIFAAMWEAFRLEYTMSSGGPGSGLFKSTDGGEHWTEITRNPGLPQTGLDGKIGVTVSGADSNRVYALVENDNGGLFRSDDAGATWTLVNSNRTIRQRAFYYTHVVADPHDKDLVYAMDTGVFRSADGGKTLGGLDATGGGRGGSFAGGDSHDLWIDPDDSNHVMHASDGGGAITYTALTQPTWSSRAYPTGQFYHVITTKHVPYHVCGAQQDSSTICVPSNTGLNAGFGRGRGGGGGAGGRGGPAADPLANTYNAGGAEPGYIATDPKDPDVYFSGGNNGSFLERLNRRTGETREVGPYPREFSGEPSSALVERIQWTFPIIFSPVDPHVLYTGTQHVWKSTDQGETWTRISPDLSRHDPKTMGDSGGPITHDMNSPEVYATVFAIGPSKKDVNVLWAGTDDGYVQVTRDGGKNWKNVTPKDMPDLGRVSIIDASAFDAGTAYVAVKKPLLDDFAPYLYRTHDYGATWTKIVTGIRADDYTHAIREDPNRRGLLYAGTQHGFYISYDDGDHWQSLSLNLPDVQVCDIAVEANDIVISTHGRGFYVLDRVGPLRQYSAQVLSSQAYLFKPDAAIRSAGGGLIQYLLRQPAKALKIEVVDAKGTVVDTFDGSSGASADTAGGAGGRGGRGGGGRGGGGFTPAAAMGTGLNSVTWSLRYPNAVSFPGMILWGGGVAGPAAPPGTYTVRMTVDGQTQTQPLVVKRHPLYSATDADLQAQFDLAIQIRDKVSEANQAVIDIRNMKQQIADRLTKSNDAKLKAAGDKLTANLSAVEADIYQVKNQSGQDPLNFPIKTNNRLASLLSMVDNGDGKPTTNAPIIFQDLSKELKAETDRLEETLLGDLAVFNTEAKRLGLDAVVRK
jgi:photosystem II stability/assembly factor-like uncharacterized protein